MSLDGPMPLIAQSSSFSSVRELIELKYPTIDYVVSHSELEESSQKLILDVFPAWKPQDLSWEQYTDGITNKLLKCTHKPTKTKVLIRAYGKNSELLIDRNQELINIVCLSEAGLCPTLYARFKNGFVYGYVEGNPFKPEDMADSKKLKLVAEAVAKWHKVDLSTGKTSPRLFPTLWKWLRCVPSQYKDPSVQEKFAKNIDIQRIKEIMTRVEKKCSAKYTKIVFCHNDLLSANIIYQEKQGEAKVAFIDYEYGCYNYRGFDIANHFCEFAGFDCDYSQYPTKEVQMMWLESYWRSYYSEITTGPTNDQLNSLYEEVNDFVPTSHLFWGLWGLAQAAVSDIPFDYMGYAIKRFNQLYIIDDQQNAKQN